MRAGTGALPAALRTLLLCVCASAASARLVVAQCPDGTPPPCKRAAAAVAAAPRSGSIAVLYFQTRDTADAYLADGLTEDVTTLLARRPGLVVKPSSSVRLAQRRAPDAPARTLGRSLAVRYVVQASLRRAADRVRLNVQLVEALSDVTVWGESYDRTAEGLLDLPGELARVIAERVAPAAAVGPGAPAVALPAPAPGGAPPSHAAPAVSPPAPAPSVAPAAPATPAVTRPASAPSGPAAPSSPSRAGALWRTTNAAALDHFRRGNYLLATREHNPEAFAEYQEAARLDPLFAAAVARSAYTLALERNVGGPESLVTRGLELANAALRLDSTSSDGWMALGYLRAFADLKTLEGAEAAFQRAVALDPLNAEAWHQYGSVFRWLGDDAAAERVIERALAIEPARAISLADLADVTYATGAFDRSLALIDSSIAINPDYLWAYWLRGVLRLERGRPGDALADAERALGVDGAAALRIEALVASGDTTRARAAAGRWLRPHAEGGWTGSLAALALGDTTWALETLERIPPGQRDAQLWLQLRSPFFDALRDNPRFQRVYRDARPVGARSP